MVVQEEVVTDSAPALLEVELQIKVMMVVLCWHFYGGGSGGGGAGSVGSSAGSSSTGGNGGNAD
jgi:hypothetical protein